MIDGPVSALSVVRGEVSGMISFSGNCLLGRGVSRFGVVDAGCYLGPKVMTLFMSRLVKETAQYLSELVDLGLISRVRSEDIQTCFGVTKAGDHRYTINDSTVEKCTTATDRFGNVGVLRLCPKHVVDHKLVDDSAIMREHGVAKNYPYKTLCSLFRCRIKYAADTDLAKSSFSMPLWYCKYWMTRVNESIRPFFSYLLGIIDKVWALCDRRFLDDIVRSVFSKIDSWLFVNSVEFDPISNVLNSLIGLSNLGGPRGWRPEEIATKLQDWVSAPVAPFQTDSCEEFETRKLADWLNTWVLESSEKMTREKTLSFEEFVTDPCKWATSGGAPAVDMIMSSGAVRVRSKWAWALDVLSKGKDVYKEAQKNKNIARVALKEESKTRLVITTPMDSYLRQSYMMYLLEKTNFLNSTITTGSILDVPMAKRWPSSVCIDASKFDHCVTKKFMIKFWRMLRDRLVGFPLHGDTLVTLCDHEIKHLEELRVEFNGIEIPYENGLLSGWRVTSLIGSIKSALVCEYIKHKMGLPQSTEYVVQGDDIIILTTALLPRDTVLECCKDMGVEVNPKKTTISPCGEFLKYRYRPDVVTGLPVRAVRSMYYSNPWLDLSVKRQPSEVMNSWNMFASRIACAWGSDFPWKDFYKDAITDTRGWMGNRISTKDMWSLLKTPVSIGGLGTIEMYRPESTKLSSIKVLSKTYESEDDKALALFGIVSGTAITKEFSFMNSIKNPFSEVQKFVLKSMGSTDRPAKLKPGHNLFKTIVETVFECGFEPALFVSIYPHLKGQADESVRGKRFFPRYLRKTSRWFERVSYILAPDKVSLPPSLFLNTRYDSVLNKEFEKICSWVTFSQKSMSAGKQVMLGIYGIAYFLRTSSFVHSL